MIAKVVVDLSLDREFDYQIPDSLKDRATIGSQVQVPFGKGGRRGFIVGLAERSSFPKLKALESVVGPPLLTEPLLKLARWMADYYASPFEHAVRTMLPGAVRRKDARHKEQLSIQLLPAAAHPEIAKELGRKAPAQARLLQWLRKNPEAFLTEAVKAADVTAAVARGLEKKGYVRIGLAAKLRDPLAGQHFLPTEPHELTSEQGEAMTVIRQTLETGTPPVILIQGITGSGKTELYLQAIQGALDQGKGAIILVPEISLTPQMMERFRGRFGGSIAVLHSHLSDGERHDEWHRIRKGEARIVLGARSALFAPVEKLGLILLDEEQEGTYKQEESPRYHARDVAVMRGLMEQCGVLLGSATPSMESVRNAQRGKFHRVHLRQRVETQSLPRMEVVDMRKEKDGEGRFSFISSRLKEALEGRIERREQSILFLNRRGFSTCVLCEDCGYVFECPSCSVAMTYHRQTREMICHICGSRSAPPRRCGNPSCKNGNLKRTGLGTQRLEDIVSRLFPHAGIARMDADTTTRKDAYHRIFSDFRSGKIDVLIGTQMIAKGLHFPNVTLVGVISADSALHLPDFRASERTFQLLVQVAGRAGRGSLDGEVIIQTHQPQNPVIQLACQADFDGFCERELVFREQLGYPPFTHAVGLLFRGRQEELVAYAAEQTARRLEKELGEFCRVGDAAPAFLARMKDEYRYRLLIRTPRIVHVSRRLKIFLAGNPMPEGVKLTVDVDAVSML